LAVLQAILWSFHNASSGRCFPSYEAIAEAAACSRTSVYHAIRALEQVGLLSWANRLVRVREYVPGLFGKASAWRWRVVRTSNAYVIADRLLASKFNSRPGTAAQDSNQPTLLWKTPPTRVPDASEKKLVADRGPGFGHAELK
jgi:hypothetical protein